MGSASHLGVVRRFGPAALSVERLEARRLLASVVIDFEGLAPGAVEDPYTEASGFRFSHLRSYGAPAGDFFAYGPPEGYASRVIHPFDFGNQFQVDRADGGAFDLLSFDYAASRFGGPGDFVITGTFASGGTQQETVSFSGSKSFSTLDLNWNDLTQVRISYAGGMNHAYGALDNFVFEVDADRPETEGTLESADPVAGPVRLWFDGREWHEAQRVLPRSDGLFYVLGASADDPYEYPILSDGNAGRVTPASPIARATRHFPDGTIDQTFDGVIPSGPGGTPMEFWPLKAGGFIGTTWSPDANQVTFSRYDNDMNPVPSFGGGDNELTRTSNRAVESVAGYADGGFVALVGGGLLLRFDADGELQDQFALSEVPLPGPEFSTTVIRGLGVDSTGRTYFAYQMLDTLSDDTAYHVVVSRLTNEFEFDATYGIGGLVSHAEGGTTGFEYLIPEELFVSDDGRAVMEFDREHGHRIMLISPEGDMNLPLDPFGSGNDFDIAAASFFDDGGLALAFRLVRIFSDRLDDDGPQVRFGAARYDAANRFDLGFSNQYPGLTVTPRREVGAFDVFTAADGTFVFGGYEESFTFETVGTDRFITDVDHVAALWRLDPAFQYEETVIDFEEMPLGQLAEYQRNGYVFRSISGTGGSDGEPLVVHGPEQGYASKVLSPLSQGRAIEISRADGQPFQLWELELAAGPDGEAGDFAFTYHYADGTSLTFGRSFAGKTLDDVQIGFPTDALSRYTLDFAGGVNDAYGVVDNIRLIHYPAVSDVVTVDFENAPLGTIASGVYTDGGYTFSSRPGDRGPASEPLLVLGPPHGYASNVLQPFNWGRRIDVERSGGGTFSLAGFDYGSDQWDELGDFILTGTFAGGGTQTRTVTFSSKTLTRLDLDWDNLTRVSINFAGGVNEAYGVVDNFVFAG